jgi:ribonuclease Z
MEIIFLGSSSGTPTRTRNVSAVAIKRANTKSWVLVDCGEGTQHQILRTNLALKHLSAIFITHVHGDHSYGLPGLLASATMTGRKDPLLIIGPKPMDSFIKNIRNFSQLKLCFDITFQPVEELTGKMETAYFSIETAELSHRVPSFAYAFTEKQMHAKLNVEKLQQRGIKPGPIWGRLQNGEDVQIEDGSRLKSDDFLLKSGRPRKIIVAGDNDKPALIKPLLNQNADVLIHEATYTDNILEKVGPEAQHSSAKNIAQFAASVSLKNLILTHFSPRYQDDLEKSPSIRDIENEARQYYQGNLFLANDFDCFHLNRDRIFCKENKHP